MVDVIRKVITLTIDNVLIIKPELRNIMIRLIQPLDNPSDFKKLNELFFSILSNKESFKFLSYSLMPVDKKTIEKLTESHKKNGLDYLIYEEAGQFTGILIFKRNLAQGFELYLLAIEKNHQQKGIGQELINECFRIAKEEGYKCIDSVVFADNKKMLRLLIKNDFMPIEIQYHMRADGMDLVKLRKIIVE